jgi:dTDP-glucose pyrophosphorylase
VDWDSNEFLYAMQADGVDAGILTFESVHPKWSFAKVNESGFVTEVAEKKPISNHATVGIYYWARGSDYVKYAEQMIAKNKRVNNEFYVCPVFNEAIEDGKKIKIFPVENMWGIGTPEDLEIFLSR